MRPQLLRVVLAVLLLASSLLAACGEVATPTPSVTTTFDKITPTSTSTPTPAPLTLTNGQLVAARPGHTANIKALAYSADGKLLVSGGYDDSLKVWEAATGKLRYTLKGHTGAVNSVAVSRDGRLIASGGEDYTVRLWDNSTGQLVKTLKGHSDRVDSVTFSSDGKRLASAGQDGSGKLWEVESGKILGSLPGAFGQVVFSPDGKRVTAALLPRQNDKTTTIVIWDGSTGQEQTHLTTPEAIYSPHLAFSPDGTKLAIASGSVFFSSTYSQLQIWDIATGQMLAAGKNQSFSCNSMSFSPDGQTVACAGSTSQGSSDIALDSGVPISIELVTDQFNYGGAVKLYRASDAQEILSHTLDNPANFVSYRPDGQQVALATGRDVVLLETNKLTEQSRLDGTPLITMLAVSLDGRTMAVAAENYAIRLLDSSSGREIGLLKGHTDDILDLAFSADGQKLASGSRDRSARIWDIASQKSTARLAGHASWVNGVAFSPDGKTLATASSDITIKLWDVSTGQERRTLNGYKSAVWQVIFSADGQKLFSRGANGYQQTTGAVRAWDVSNGQEIALNLSLSVWVAGLALSPDGSLVTVSELGEVKQWNIKTGQEMQTYRVAQPLPKDKPNSYDNYVTRAYVGFSRDGASLVSWQASYKEANLWGYNAVTGQEVMSRTLTTESAAVALLPDNATIALAERDGTIKLDNLAPTPKAATATPTVPLPTPVPATPTPPLTPAGPVSLSLKYTTPASSGHTSTISALAYSPDGQFLLTASGDGFIKLWDKSGREVRSMGSTGNSVTSVAFSPDSKTILSGGYDKKLHLWDTASGKELKTFDGHTDTVKEVAFGPDGRWVASGSGNYSQGQDNTVRIWDVASGQELFKLTGHTAMIDALAVSADNTTVASGDWDGKIRLWNRATGQPLSGLNDTFSHVLSLAYSPDGKTLAATDYSGAITLWDATAGYKKLNTVRASSEYAPKVVFSPDGKIIASGNSDGTSSKRVTVEVKLFEVATGQLIRTIPAHTLVVEALAFSPDGQTLAVGGGGGVRTPGDTTVKLWNVASGQETATVGGGGGSTWLWGFSQDGATFQAVVGDSTIKEYDAKTGKELKAQQWPYLGEATLAFSPDDKLVARSARSEKVIHIYEAATVKEITALYGSVGDIRELTFSPDGQELWSVDASANLIRKWKVSDWQELASVKLEGDASSLFYRISQDYKLLAGEGYDSGDKSHIIKIWDITTGKLVSTLKGHTSFFWSFDFSADSQRMITTSNDKTSRIWDVQSGRELLQLANDNAFGTPHFANRDRWLVGEEKGQLFILDSGNGKVLFSSPAPGNIQSYSFSPDYKLLLTSQNNGSISLWEVKS